MTKMSRVRSAHRLMGETRAFPESQGLQITPWCAERTLQVGSRFR